MKKTLLLVILMITLTFGAFAIELIQPTTGEIVTTQSTVKPSSLDINDIVLKIFVLLLAILSIILGSLNFKNKNSIMNIINMILQILNAETRDIDRDKLQKIVDRYGKNQKTGK